MTEERNLERGSARSAASDRAGEPMATPGRDRRRAAPQAAGAGARSAAGSTGVRVASGRPQTAKRPAPTGRKELPKAQKKKRRKKLIVRLAVTLIVIIICAVCFLFTFRVFYDTALDPENTTKVEVTITDPEITHEEVAEMLVEAGCIDDAKLYKLRTFIYDADYKPGTYKVSPSFTTEKIINILSGYDYSDGTMET